MLRDFNKDEYKVRWIPAKIAAAKRESIYLFRIEDVTVKIIYSSRSRVFQKIKPVLDLMQPIRTSTSTDIKDYVMTKDEFESITGKRP